MTNLELRDALNGLIDRLSLKEIVESGTSMAETFDSVAIQAIELSTVATYMGYQGEWLFRTAIFCQPTRANADDLKSALAGLAHDVTVRIWRATREVELVAGTPLGIVNDRRIDLGLEPIL